MKRISLIASVFSLLVATSCANKSASTQPGPVVQGAQIETVKTSSVDDYYEAVGTVQAKTSSVVAARIMGNITSVRVREGDRVRAGQTVIEIENRDAPVQIQKAQAGVRESNDALDEAERNIHAAESARDAARANESLASSTFNRYQTLFNRQSVSPQEFDEVRTKLEIAKAESQRSERMLQAAKARQNQTFGRIDQAKADVSNARIYAGYSRLTSPINGVVVAKHVDVGSMTTPGAPLLTIENDANYQLEVSVEESQLGKIHPGDQASVTIEALGNQELTCSVVEIVPTADPNSRSYAVKLSLPNISGQQLRSGIYGKARFVSGARNVLSVPQKAITQNGQLVSVFVVDQSGTARMRLIKTGENFGERVEVLSGLNDGEQIVSETFPQLKDGARVRESRTVASN
jgi:multidrug efflux pump subunit AcrA (membrane-fusion protein)